VKGLGFVGVASQIQPIPGPDALDSDSVQGGLFRMEEYKRWYFDKKSARSYVQGES